jgi:hypothetical protein
LERLHEVALIEDQDCYASSNPVTRGDASIIQFELRNIQYLLINIFEQLNLQGSK